MSIKLKRNQVNQIDVTCCGFSMSRRKRIELSESSVTLMWQQLLGKELRAEDGEQITAIYPGRINSDDGPDFRNAVVAMSGSGLMRGDVEVHVRSSDWYSHGHSGNPRYENVVLHVVMWHNSKKATLGRDGEIPVLCLSKTLKHQPYLLPYSYLSCFHVLEHMDRLTLGNLLNITGIERFRQKAAFFRIELEHEEAGQVLFQGMMRALGYSKNSEGFVELARRVTLGLLENGEQRESLVWKLAWLLGMAGLLPSQRLQNSFEEGLVRELERIWWLSGNGANTMKESDWCLSHVYPNNSPLRRIVAQSYLLQRYSEEGLLSAMIRLVQQASLVSGHRELEESLLVSGDDYWQEHCDFGIKTAKAALLGRSKAGEIIINVVLPFVFSWGEKTEDSELKGKALQLYLDYHGLAENEITRHMTRQLCLEGPGGLTACQQQGLIHIFRNYCREGKCSECPLLVGG